MRDELQLGRQRQVQFIPHVDKCVGVQVKLKSLDNAYHTWVLLQWSSFPTFLLFTRHWSALMSSRPPRPRPCQPRRSLAQGQGHIIVSVATSRPRCTFCHHFANAHVLFYEPGWGSYTLSHTYDQFLARSHHYHGKNWKNWTSFFWRRSLTGIETSR